MKCRILHESIGRLRVHMMQGHMTLDQADILEYYLKSFDFITDAVVYERTADAVIRYRGDRAEVINALSSFCYEENHDLVPEKTGRDLAHEFEDKVFLHVAGRILNLVFLPAGLRNIITAVKAVRFLKDGIAVLASGHVQVPVLDAATIGVSMLRGDFDTAGNVIFLLGLSEILEEWTHKKTVDDLARSMSLNIDKVWLKTAEGQEMLVPVSEIRAGDMIVVRTSNTIPLDGIVSAGEASVNQASLTGESLPVRKEEGAYVYAGTVIEEGEITITVKNMAGAGRYDRIVEMIEESEKLKSDSENRAAALADHPGFFTGPQGPAVSAFLRGRGNDVRRGGGTDTGDVRREPYQPGNSSVFPGFYPDDDSGCRFVMTAVYSRNQRDRLDCHGFIS